MSRPKFELVDAIAAFLIEESPTAGALTDLVGDRVYTDVTPEDLSPPPPDPHLIIYELDSTPEESLSGPGDLEHTRIQVACRADQPSVATKMRRYVRDALHGHRGQIREFFISNISLVTRVRQANAPVDGGQPKRNAIIEFRISHSVPLPAPAAVAAP